MTTKNKLREVFKRLSETLLSKNHEDKYFLNIDRMNFLDFEHLAFWMTFHNDHPNEDQFVACCLRLDENEDNVEQFLVAIEDLNIASKNLFNFMQKDLELFISYAAAYSAQKNDIRVLGSIEKNILALPDMLPTMNEFLLAIRMYSENALLINTAQCSYDAATLTISSTIPEKFKIAETIKHPSVTKVAIRNEGAGDLARLLNELKDAQNVRHLALSGSALNDVEVDAFADFVKNKEKIDAVTLYEASFSLIQKEKIGELLREKGIVINGNIALDFLNTNESKFNKHHLLNALLCIGVGAAVGALILALGGSVILSVSAIPIVAITGYAVAELYKRYNPESIAI